MIVLALIYSFCFEDTVSLSIPIKRHNFVKLRCIIVELQGLKVEQFPIHFCNFSRDCSPAKMATKTLKGSNGIFILYFF